MKKSLLLIISALTLSFTAQAKVVECSPNTNAISWWLTQGDTLVLADGEYSEAYTISFNIPDVCVKAAEGAKPVIKLTGEWTAFNVSASTTFDGITFDGTNVAKYIIATHDSTSLTTDLTIKNCEFKNWNQWAISNQYEDKVSVNSVVIDNCLFDDAMNSAVYFSDKAAEGKNACQDLKITNSTFYNIGDASAYTTIYCVGGNDVETQKVTVDHCTFYNCQAKSTDHAAVRVTCAATISNTIIVAPESQGTYRAIHATDGSNAQAINCLTYNYEKDNGGIRGGATTTECQLNVDPKFVDAANGNFALAEGSPALRAGTDGSNLGDPRWNAPAVEEPEGVTYELNGGELPKVKVPTNAELWGTDTADVNGLMHYFNHYHNLKRSAQDISADVSTNPVATFLTGMPDEAGVFVDEESKYKWLGDYIIKVTNDQIAEGKLSVLKAVDSNIKWRYGVQAFFMCLPATDSNYKGWADFTEAGKPENWGAAYQAAHEVVLPTEPVEEDYTLPTPVKEGCTFVGWYDNAEGTGKAYTVIPAGWSGTLYAIWEAEGPTTALDNIAVEGKAVKAIINGQLIIVKDGVKFNALGQVIK